MKIGQKQGINFDATRIKLGMQIDPFIRFTMHIC